MAGNLSGIFNQDQAPDAPEFELLPPGEYLGDITKAELKETRSGGYMIALTIKLDNNRSVFDNLNIQCASQKASEIAQASLKKIGQTNAKVIQDTDDLLMCRVRVNVGVQPGDGQYGPRNTVKYYMDPAKGTTAPRQVARSAAAAVTAPASRPAATCPAAQPPAEGGGRWMRDRKPADNRTSEEVLKDEIPF
ncbi:DUF669 domain-containing protein [Acetobacter sp. P5B1]|uniref:DUF669 domain-containing protein n=1 Tax=Acetobacter sp. P5B1 TaxID=2762620 RepID=UPI001C041E01|nr:DUF669 domain-containing protein [Acetobacter sp. P5B1]